jgi:hypothetical protein
MNVLGAIRNVTNLLAYSVEVGGQMSGMDEPLKFLVHFMGDMHMPLHLTGRDRGGNGDKVLWDGRITSKWFLYLSWTRGSLGLEKSVYVNTTP